MSDLRKMIEREAEQALCKYGWHNPLALETLLTRVAKEAARQATRLCYTTDCGPNDVVPKLFGEEAGDEQQ